MELNYLQELFALAEKHKADNEHAKLCITNAWNLYHRGGKFKKLIPVQLINSLKFSVGEDHEDYKRALEIMYLME